MTNQPGPVACRGVRGATTACANTSEAILEATQDLLEQIVAANGIHSADIASIIFSATPDLNAAYPAAAARALGWADVALLCTHEMDVPGGLARAIRVLIHWNTDTAARDIRHIYINGAEVLRSDRVIEEERLP